MFPHAKLAAASLVLLSIVPYAGAARAEAPSSVPSVMPFDIPYGTSIGIEAARRLIDAAIADATKRNWKMNIAVVGPSGDLVMFARMDGAQLASVGISQRKARTAAAFRRETRVFAEAIGKGHVEVVTLGSEFIAIPGGFPIVKDGQIVGAIGCSGGTSDQDSVVCKAALDAQK